MKRASAAVAILLFSMLALAPSQAQCQDWVIINHALVFNRQMPPGTAVKVRIDQISDELFGNLMIVMAPENAFKVDQPGTSILSVKAWRSDYLRVGDVVNYTTKYRGFVGIFAGDTYNNLQAQPTEGGYLLTMNYNSHRWVIEVSFPDYEQLTQ